MKVLKVEGYVTKNSAGKVALSLSEKEAANHELLAVLPAGTALEDWGTKAYHYRVAERQIVEGVPTLEGEFVVYYEDEDAALVTLGFAVYRNGEQVGISFSRPSAGWNFTVEWHDITTDPYRHAFMTTCKFFKFRAGETWADLPLTSQEDQIAWLQERETRWYPAQEMKPVKYRDPAKILAVETLDDLVTTCGITQDSLQYRNHNERDGYLKQGFYLGMPTQEARELGARLYYGFRWGEVQGGLKYTWEEWITPPVWIKETVQERVRRGHTPKSHIEKYQERFLFRVTTDHETGEKTVKVARFRK